MGDHEITQVRPPEQLTITVLRARNLRGQRGDTVNALIKVECGEKPMGETPKVECTAEEPAEFNYNSTVNVNFEDPLTIDELVCKPVLLTVIEVLPKEKKQKEEKTVQLGQCTVDLLPIVSGETKQIVTVAINPLPGSPLENLPTELPRPEVDVQLSVNEPLLSESQLKECNLMSMTLESLYSPPESWGTTGQQYFYTAVTPMPLTGDKENAIVYAGGQIKPGVDKEVPNKQKKWAVPGNAVSGSVYIPEVMLAGDAIEDEDGDFKGKDDREHRTVAEQDKNRVTWNIERRSYLDPGATKSFQDKIAKSRYWPLEVVRTAMPTGGKGKKEDDGTSFHGVVFLNLAPLLYPGVKRIRGAYKVYAYSDQELNEKCQRRGGLADDAVRIANGILSRSSSSPFPKPGKGGKEDTKGKDPKKGQTKKGATDKSDKGSEKASTERSGPQGDPREGPGQPSLQKASDSASDADGPAMNAEGMQYVDAKSYVMFEISMHRPLVPKRQPDELAKKVAEYIPPRPRFPKRTDGATKSVEDYHSQVGVVANLILDEFREHFGDAVSAQAVGNPTDAMEERRQKLVYHLNSSGKYFAFKEQLKYAVVKIVREKYMKTTNFKDKDELQTFLSELYVYLVDQMHVGLSKVLAIEDQSPIPEPLTDSAQLKHFAREAEVNENFELAAKYYQERIARDRNDPDHWLDYGTFCLYINDLTKAEECFKECVAIDQRHMYGLILYGVVCTMQDKHEAAETFFEAATSVEPKGILPWTMFAMFYDGIGNEIGAEMALAEANRLNVHAAAEVVRSAREDEERHREEQVARERESAEPRPESSPDAAGTELKNASADPGGPAIKQTPATPTSSVAGSDTKNKKNAAPERKGSAAQARKSGKARSNENLSRPGSNSQRSRSPAQPGGAAAAPQAGEEHGEDQTPPPREPTPVPTTSIYMEVVEFLLEVKAMSFTERALSHHLLDHLGGPSAEYHIALARLALQKHNMEEAEESLKEALQFDHQNPDAWAIMGHVKYLVGDTDNAKHCYERTLTFVGDASEMHSIYLRLASIYLQEGKFQDAKNTFLMACKRSPSCVSWLGVGIACYRLGELGEAEDGLSEANILNNTDPEVWAFLSLVCLRTGRQVEAEQSYKYAIKLNLPDEDLLNELHQVQEEVGFGNPQL